MYNRFSSFQLYLYHFALFCIVFLTIVFDTIQICFSIKNSMGPNYVRASRPGSGSTPLVFSASSSTLSFSMEKEIFLSNQPRIYSQVSKFTCIKTLNKLAPTMRNLTNKSVLTFSTCHVYTTFILPLCYFSSHHFDPTGLFEDSTLKKKQKQI